MTTPLQQGYRRCAALTRRHGTTYYWGTQLLAPAQRRDVYAVYALCRLADDIIDEPGAVGDLAVPAAGEPGARLDAYERAFRDALAGGHGDSPVMAAIAATVRARGIPLDCFDRFFTAMRLDLTRTWWASWEELREVYMEGSAAAIGEMMLPVLEPVTPQAKEPARALGLAFQLTNFIRDVGEDLDRGRVYLPADDLARHGADVHARRVTPAWRAFLAEQIERNRELYRAALPGVAMLPGPSARCVGVALRMYAEILHRIERADYDVFAARHRVSRTDKAGILAQAGLRGPARVAVAGLDATKTPMTPAPPDPPAGPPAPRPRAAAGRVPVKRLPRREPADLRPTWREAALPRIERALARAQQRDPGGWYVVGASRDVGAGRSIVRTVAGREVVLWRDERGALVAGPGECPHMGASLHACPVIGSELLCRWHGLRLQAGGDRRWRPYPAHDDGVLAWIRLETAGETPSAAPARATRPDLRRSVIGVVAMPGTCEPADVLANRLDPWHGAWFHPYAFSHLTVDEAAGDADRLVTDVTFRLGATWGVPVRAEFTCPDARSIVMTITDGEGAGSVVETHATPVGVDRDGHPVTMVVEAGLAYSPRPGFALAHRFAPLVEPLIRRTQRRLWVDDLDYAERRYLLRTRNGTRAARPVTGTLHRS